MSPDALHRSSLFARYGVCATPSRARKGALDGTAPALFLGQPLQFCSACAFSLLCVTASVSIAFIFILFLFLFLDGDLYMGKQA